MLQEHLIIKLKATVPNQPRAKVESTSCANCNVQVNFAFCALHHRWPRYMPLPLGGCYRPKKFLSEGC